MIARNPKAKTSEPLCEFKITKVRYTIRLDFEWKQITIFISKLGQNLNE